MITREEAAALLVAIAHPHETQCRVCGKPGSCIGAYELDAVLAPACDACCGHGNEDGHCTPIAEHLDDALRTVVALYDERAAALDGARRLWPLLDSADPVVCDLAHVLAEVDRDRRALYDERDALALELRRLRAAEAPGTDDAAFEGTGWDWLDGAWVHVSGPVVGMDEEGLWTSDDVAQRNELALDAMRAAVPGSV